MFEQAPLDWFGEQGHVAPTLTRLPLPGEEKREMLGLLDLAKF
jgi:hypothetical protein